MYNTYISLEFARLQQGELHPNSFVLNSKHKTYKQKAPAGVFCCDSLNANYQHLYFDI